MHCTCIPRHGHYLVVPEPLFRVELERRSLHLARGLRFPSS
jgi:hypothetical protein